MPATRPRLPSLAAAAVVVSVLAACSRAQEAATAEELVELARAAARAVAAERVRTETSLLQRFEAYRTRTLATFNGVRGDRACADRSRVRTELETIRQGASNAVTEVGALLTAVRAAPRPDGRVAALAEVRAGLQVTANSAQRALERLQARCPVG